MAGNSPQFLQIEPTTRCNFICGFCAGRCLPQIDMDFGDFQAIVDAIDHIVHIELQGEGEPLLHPRFFEMIRYTREKHPAVSVSLITNGSLFTDHNIQQILQNDISRIFVSIESANDEQFQQIRGGKLDRVKRGIKTLVETKNKISGGTPLIGFAVTMLKSTVPQINSIGALYHQLDMDGGLMIQPLQKMECYTQFYTPDIFAEIPTTQDKQAFRQLIVNDHHLQEIFSSPISRKGFYQALRSSVVDPSRTCAWLENGLYVSADGTACSCCFVKDARKDGFDKLNSKTIPGIMESRFNMLARLKSGQLPRQCLKCEMAHTVLRSRQASTGAGP